MSSGRVPGVQREGFKLLGEHREGCFAAASEDGITFVIDDRDKPHDFGRRRNGDRGGSSLWHRFACNDPSCEAILMVRWDKLAGFINGREDFDPYA